MNPPSAHPAVFPQASTTFHPSLGAVRYSIRRISDEPNQQVEDTIDIMRQYVLEDLSDSSLRADTVRARQGGDPITDTWNYLHRGGLRGMSFVRDEVTAQPFAGYEFAIAGRWLPIVESIARPELLAKIENPHGDCDCFCCYGAAHLLLKDVSCSFVTVAADASDPETYTHVYLVAYPDSGPYAGQRVPLDLSHGPYPGWEVQKVFRRREWPLQSDLRPWMFAAGALGIGALLYSCARKERLVA